MLKKMPAVLAANLVEILASLTSNGFALVLFVQMYMLKVVTFRTRYPDMVDDSEFLEYENGWYFFIAWLGSCASFGLLFSLIFQEIYESMDMIDSATTVLSFLVVYLMMMLFWLVVQYILPKRKNAGNVYAYTFIFLAIASAVVVSVLVFATLHENPWYHYLVIALYVGPVFAIFATNSASTFRKLRPGIDTFTTIEPGPGFASRTLNNDTSTPVYYMHANGAPASPFSKQ